MIIPLQIRIEISEPPETRFIGLEQVTIEPAHRSYVVEVVMLDTDRKTTTSYEFQSMYAEGAQPGHEIGSFIVDSAITARLTKLRDQINAVLEEMSE